MGEPSEVQQFALDWVPYFVSSVLLNADMYEKGVFIGKQVEDFKKVKKAYSEKVGKIDGEKLSKVTEFCIWYNEDSLTNLRKAILKEQGFTLDQFDNEYIVKVDDDKSVKYPGHKYLSNEDLDRLLTKEQKKVVKRAKKATVKGINTNILLGNEDVSDPTDIGPNEKELTIRHNIKTTIIYLFVTGAMSLIFVKKINEWQWTGIIEVIFKLSLIFGRALMSYLKGYKDTVVTHSNHLIRKTDILDIFEVWYDKNFVVNANIDDKV